MAHLRTSDGRARLRWFVVPALATRGSHDSCLQPATPAHNLRRGAGRRKQSSCGANPVEGERSDPPLRCKACVGKATAQAIVAALIRCDRQIKVGLSNGGTGSVADEICLVVGAADARD